MGCLGMGRPRLAQRRCMCATMRPRAAGDYCLVLLPPKMQSVRTRRGAGNFSRLRPSGMMNSVDFRLLERPAERSCIESRCGREAVRAMSRRTPRCRDVGACISGPWPIEQVPVALVYFLEVADDSGRWEQVGEPSCLLGSPSIQESARAWLWSIDLHERRCYRPEAPTTPANLAVTPAARCGAGLRKGRGRRLAGSQMSPRARKRPRPWSSTRRVHLRNVSSISGASMTSVISEPPLGEGSWLER